MCKDRWLPDLPGLLALTSALDAVSDVLSTVLNTVSEAVEGVTNRLAVLAGHTSDYREEAWSVELLVQFHVFRDR